DRVGHGGEHRTRAALADLLGPKRTFRLVGIHYAAEDLGGVFDRHHQVTVQVWVQDVAHFVELHVFHDGLARTHDHRALDLPMHHLRIDRSAAVVEVG